MTVAETTLGVKRMVRASAESGQRWFTKIAKASPSSVTPGTMIERVEEDVHEGDADPWVGEGGAVVVEPDPRRRAEDAPLGEADIDAEQHRPDIEDEEGNGEEGDEGIAGPVDVAAAGMRAGRHRGRRDLRRRLRPCGPFLAGEQSALRRTPPRAPPHKGEGEARSLPPCEGGARVAGSPPSALRHPRPPRLRRGGRRLIA